MSIAIQIGQIMFPLIAIVSMGIFIGVRKHPELDSINDINLHVFIPALVFSSLLQQQFEFKEFALLGLSGLVLVLLTAVIAIPFARLFNIQYHTIAPPMMFHNAGNIGLPLMSLALGTKGLAAGLILFLVGNITHFGLGSYMLDQNAKWIRSITSPAILAAILALFLQSQNIQLSSFIILPIHMLGSIAVPLMLFSLGVQLTKANFDFWRLGLLVAILTPAIGVALALIIAAFVPLEKTQIGALILFGALPPAVMNFLFAKRYQQEPTKVSAIVLVGNLLAIITLPLALLFVLPRFS
ncbi:MAG: AEC family transporter [Gammaproteobacteria bacterium]